MNNKKIKKLLAFALVNAFLAGGMPLRADAEWMKNSSSDWNWIEDGSKVTDWKFINNEWYYFDSNGNMKTDWIESGGKWYYLSESGSMKTGWIKDSSNTWYYLNASGDMKTGWLYYNNKWYYLNDNGSMQTGWLKYKNNWYYLSGDGSMKAGWIDEGNGRHYFADSTGVMQTGIIEVDGKTYALDSNGLMMTGKVTISNVEYTADSAGVLTGDNIPKAENRFDKNGLRLENSNNTSYENTSDNAGDSTTSSSSSSSGSSNHHHSSNSNNYSNIEEGADIDISSEGTYGSEGQIVNVKNVSINSPNVVLKNVHVTGDLILGEGVGEGTVTLENVTVDGNTIVNGGGENSVYFKDTTIATVIVNKNDGKIRIVVEGKSAVHEVQLESTAKLEEKDLTSGSEGFTDVSVNESVQSRDGINVQLIGRFETINSRSDKVKIQLDENTSIDKLVLSVASTVLGEGTINTAVINADGSTISTRPQNVVLNANSVSLRDQVVTESYSSATSASIKGIKADMSSIKVDMDSYIAGVTINDFKVSATLDGQEVELNGFEYDAANERIYYKPIDLTGNTGKTLKITVAPASEKLTGGAKTSEVIVSPGFSGKITDIHGVGISNLTINFKKESDSDDSENITAVTDEDGYYSVNAQPGQYIGEITGTGIIATTMYASSISDFFNVQQNETAIRATAMDAVKIVLSWGKDPYDEDSHLEGPTTEGGKFHTWYPDKIYEGTDGIRYVDLDWDDVDSYGPETTTIYKLVDGTYIFYVHNFSGESPLVGSGAKVQVYEGSSSTPKKEIKLKDDSLKKEDRYWYVFEMKVSDNGSEIDIDEINELRESVFIKKSASAELSYFIDDGEENILGVPSGTIADLKRDLLPYDGDEIKVFSGENSIDSVDDFNSEQELNDTDIIKSGQIVSVKHNDLVKSYVITTLTDGVDIDIDVLNYTLNQVSESDYTAESWSVYQGKVTEIMSREINTQDQLNDAKRDLLDAQEQLVRISDLPYIDQAATTSAAVSISASENNDQNSVISEEDSEDNDKESVDSATEDAVKDQAE
ncbi:MAG: hypothetical protein Q4F66_03370 [Clostridium sp.]|nr:hypothetical protein [Clostridium sp.]